MVKVFRDGRAGVPACNGISFDVPAGKFFTLLGPSGCGKTTTLRSVAGLERPDAGEIVLDGAVVYSSRGRVFVPPNRRDVGMVFQSYATPHPNGAKLFENFLISREGMEIMARQGEFVTAKGIFPPIKDADKINPVAIDELSSEEFKKWAAVFRPLFVAR